MAKVVQISKLKLTAEKYKRPAIRSYNRIEASPRSHEFNSSVRMEVRDPLWFLCRQWQFGEFQGEDAGSACTANILGQHFKPGAVTNFQGNRTTYDPSVPLETYIEKEALDVSLHLRAQLGKIFLRLLKSKGMGAYQEIVRTQYPISPMMEDQDVQGLLLSKSLSHLLPDGFLLLEDVKNGGFKTWYESLSDIDTADHADLQAAGEELVAWFERQYEQPDESFWRPEHLEYSFNLESKSAARKKRILKANEYASGHLDWKDFDQEEISSAAGIGELKDPEEVVQTFIPTPLQFSGMPHPRLWQLEENTTNFGNIDASKRTILNLLLSEFGLTYSNDWFVLPYEMEINTLCEIEHIKVTDVFGVHTLVSPNVHESFAQFHQTEINNNSIRRNLFYLAPSIGQVMESDNLDEVVFLRDEISNMVWAIERTVISADGRGRDVKRNVPSLADFSPAGEEAKIRYVLGNTVPDNWIPFIPVQKKKSNGSLSNEIWLQRARMPQAPPAKSRILTEVQPVQLIEEQEIGREGVLIERRFQRTRWLNGKTVVWVGRKKSAGSGEGYANLSFDQLHPIG